MVFSDNDFGRGVDFGMLLQRVAHAGDFQESDELSLFERMKGAASVLQLDLRTEDMRNEVGAAFKALSRIAHPDKVPGTWKKKAEDTFQLLNAARELLNQRRPGDELERIDCFARDLEEKIGSCRLGKDGEGGQYVGTVTADGKPNGFGCVHYDDGEMFVGEFVHDGVQSNLFYGTLYDKEGNRRSYMWEGLWTASSIDDELQPTDYPLTHYIWWLTIQPSSEPSCKRPRVSY
jgi:hypothetical protein